jgi:hypothetical protein
VWRRGGTLALGLALVAGGVLVQTLDLRDRQAGQETMERVPTVSATPAPSVRPPAASPADRLTVSRPRRVRGVFAPHVSAGEGVVVNRGRVAHPRRASFVPTGLSLVAGASGQSGGRAPVDPVATLPDGSLALPEDPRRLGWWTGGSAIGAPYGSVVLAGHLDSREHGLGFAARLVGLRVGDAVEVSDPDQAVRYRVHARYLLPRTRLAALTALFSDRGPARLVLITCGGAYDHERGAYADNLVVEATPVRRVAVR